MATVKARPDEDVESLLRRFKKAVDNAGILSDLRRTEYYEKPGDKRRKQKKAGVKRAKKMARTRKTKPSQANWKWNKDRTKKIYFVPRKPNTIRKVRDKFARHSNKDSKR